MKVSLTGQVDRPIGRLLRFDYMTWSKYSRQNICDRVLPLSEGPGVKNLKYISRGKKITCPGAQDKLNFRQDKHKFSPNVLWTSKEFTDSLFFLDKDKLFGNRTSKNFDVLARGTSENF